MMQLMLSGFFIYHIIPNPDKPEPNIYPQIHTNKRSLMNKNEKERFRMFREFSVSLFRLGTSAGPVRTTDRRAVVIGIGIGFRLGILPLTLNP